MRRPSRWSAAVAAIPAAILWIGPAILHAEQTPPMLTLAEAVKEALVSNDRIVNQHDALEQAALAVHLARNAFQPKLVPNVLGSFGQTNVSNQTYRLDLTQRFMTGTEMQLGVGTSTSQIPSTPGTGAQGDVRFYNADTTLTLTQPLLRGFGPEVTRRSLASAELREADAGRQRTLSEQQVVVEVAAAYFRVTAQRALVEVGRKSLERARKLLEASQAKLVAGLVSQLDVYRAQQLVAQAGIQLSDSDAAVLDAYDQLRLLLGREGDAPFEVSDTIPKPTDQLMPVEDAIRLALERRTDLQSAMAAMGDADRVISFARNQLRPQFDVNLALTRRETANSLANSFGFDRFQFATFFTISTPVDRTPQLVEYQNALIDRDRRQREVDVMRKRITADVKRAVRETDRMVRNLAVSEDSVEIGRKEVEVAQFRYERGLSNNLDVVTAESNLLNAESRRLAAQAELAVARLGFRATLGILDPRQDVVQATQGLSVVADHE